MRSRLYDFDLTACFEDSSIGQSDLDSASGGRRFGASQVHHAPFKDSFWNFLTGRNCFDDILAIWRPNRTVQIAPNSFFNALPIGKGLVTNKEVEARVFDEKPLLKVVGEFFNALNTYTNLQGGH